MTSTKTQLASSLSIMTPFSLMDQTIRASERALGHKWAKRNRLRRSAVFCNLFPHTNFKKISRKAFMNINKKVLAVLFCVIKHARKCQVKFCLQKRHNVWTGCCENMACGCTHDVNRHPPPHGGVLPKTLGGGVRRSSWPFTLFQGKIYEFCYPFWD